MELCSAYGLGPMECTVLLSLGCVLGFNEAVPMSTLEGFGADGRRVEDMLQKLRNLDVDGDNDESSRMYMEMLAESEKDRYLVLAGDDYQVSIDKG